jgi:putative tricarboxylic transport membrane protein
MKVHDSFIGAAVFLFGAFVAIYANTLTPPRHLQYGPGFFPFLIGIGLVAVGAGIFIKGARDWRGQAPFVVPVWIKSGQAALKFWIMPAAIVFYLIAVVPLGFLATATIILATAFLVNGVSPVRGLPLALVIAIVVNIAFASILHVPLPWGVLTSVSRWLIW